jgi:serine/threonine-protein kinase
MAVVFRAMDERLGRTVAMKVLAPALAGDGQFRERFIRESRAAAAVDHPHIIPVYGAGEADGILYLSMRYVSGGDLRSVMHREGPLPAERTAFLLSPVASALDAAHAAGLVHRDVKPANILVDMSPGRPEHLYLSDFGLAKDAASVAGLTGTGQFLGTADYAAPEQVSGGRAHMQTDQYALACVAFTMLTGELPFARNEPMAVLWAHLNDPPPSVTARRPDLSPAVDQVLARGLAKDPAARYPSCGDFAGALRAALGAGPYSVPADVPAPAFPGQSARAGLDIGGTGGTEGGAALAGATRPPGMPAGRRRGVLAAASGVAAVAGAAVLVAASLHHGSGNPRQSSSGSTAGQASSPKAAAPKAAASATGGTGGKPAGRGAVTGRPVRFTNPGSVPNVATAFSTDGSLITVGTNGTAYIWDVTARAETSDMAAPGGYTFQRAAVSPDGGTIAAQASGGAAYIFRGGTTSSTLPAGERLYPGSIATAGLTLATEDAARTGVDVWVGPLATAPHETLINPDNGADLTSVALSVDATTVAASDESGRTDVWNANTHARTHVLEPPDRSVVNCSVFSFGGGVLVDGSGLLVTGDRDGRAYLWNATTGALLRSVRDPRGSVDRVAISIGGSLLATAGTGNAIYLWNTTTGASLGMIRDPGGVGVTSLAFGGTMDTKLAVADKNGTTYVWTLRASA